MAETHTNLAEQALANLVNQFARPLDFLRELAQNSIDAGSPRIEVSVAFDPPKAGEPQGVLQIHVDDFGEGMDEQIIDDQLTRLFSSSKEDDLTKIGKFGIGFTSIFAIQPQAVLLRTGRHGEYWELLFHADRSFDKVRVDSPVQGTQITLFKRTDPDRVPAFIEECRFILEYWCEHSDVPITFRDRTLGEEAEEVDGEDPFAPFANAEASGALQRVNRPLTLDESPFVRHQAEGVEVVVGCAEQPRFGFYNGGLTLLNTPNADALGKFAGAVAHLSFKVKHDHLEHTLTRDNVLQDANWERAMEAVLHARTTLRETLLAGCVEACAAGDRLGPWHAWLAAECRADDDDVAADGAERRAFLKQLRLATIFRDYIGRPVTLGKVRQQEAKVGGVLFAGGSTPLHDALDGLGIVMVEDHPDTRALLAETEDAPMFEVLRTRRSMRRADEVFVLPALVEPSDLSPLERALIDHTADLLRVAVGVRLRLPRTERVLRWAPGKDSAANRLTLRVGDFGGMDLGRTDVLALNGPRGGGVFMRPERSWFRLPAFLTWRTLLVNRHHGLFRAQLLASAEDPHLAAFGLAQALLCIEGIEGDASFDRMLAAALETLDAAS